MTIIEKLQNITAEERKITIEKMLAGLIEEENNNIDILKAAIIIRFNMSSDELNAVIKTYKEMHLEVLKLLVQYLENEQQTTH